MTINELKLHHHSSASDFLYRIYWVSTITGKSGRGSPISLEDANLGIRYAHKFPKIHHWIDVEIPALEIEGSNRE